MEQLILEAKHITGEDSDWEQTAWIYKGKSGLTNTVRWTENCRSRWAPRAVTSSTKSSFRQLTRGVPTPGVHTRPKLIELCIPERGDGTEHALSQSADDTPAERAAIQRDFDRVEVWADTNPTKFNKGKCKVLHLGRNNPTRRYRLGANWLETGFAEDDLVYNELNVSQQRALAAKMGNSVSGCIRKTLTSGQGR